MNFASCGDKLNFLFSKNLIDSDLHTKDRIKTFGAVLPFAADYATAEEWEKEPYRIAAKIHPLTVEQNALTSFKSRTTLVPCRANTIGPGLFLQADYAIGGADGTLGRGMQWQGMSLWMTLRYGKTPWITSSYIPTLAGRLFFLKELAGPLVAECN